MSCSASRDSTSRKQCPSRQRHRPAVGEIDVAQHPSGGIGPGQHAEGRRIRHHDEVAGAGHLVEPHAAARGEHRENRAVRGVFSKKRRGHRDAGAQRISGFGGDQRLAAQNAVLIGKGEAHHLELALLDFALDLTRNAALLRRPQIVTVDKFLRPGRERCGAITALCRLSCAVTTVDHRPLAQLAA